MEAIMNGDLAGIAMGIMCPVCVIAGTSTAREIARNSPAGSQCAAPALAISALPVERVDMPSDNGATASDTTAK